jgi:hypothetical protein
VLFGLLSRLQKIWTFARAVERSLALLAAALRTDIPVYSRAKPLFLPFFTNQATQARSLGFDYFTEKRSSPQGASR